jgi:hypothetical protein
MRTPERPTFLVLNLCLDVLDRVGRFHLQRDRLARQGLDEDLHAAAEAQYQMKRALLLNVVVGERAPILKLLASKDQTLLIRGNACGVRQGGHAPKVDLPYELAEDRNLCTYHQKFKPSSSDKLGTRRNETHPPCPGFLP